MKLVTFSSLEPAGAAPRLGAVVNNQHDVLDLCAAAAKLGGDSGFFTDMAAFLTGGEAAHEAAARLIESAGQQQLPEVTHPIKDQRLWAPLPRPASIRDCLTFERHLIETTRTVAGWRSRPLAALDRWAEKSFGKGILRIPKVWYERPLYYKGNPASVVGHESDIRWPGYTEKLDFELEFGIYIGRQGRDISASEAGDYIAGYTIFNDFSARDVQLREMQGRLGPAKGKDFDTGNVMGPWMATPDELDDPYQLEMLVRVNKEQWTRTSSAEMQFRFEEIIAYVSQAETLYPGDFIGAGTAPGGCGLELDRWLAPGDVVELEVEGLGVLRNRVVRS